MGRNRSLLFAFLLIGIGVVLLLQQADVIPEDVNLGPIILIGIGLLLLVNRVVAGGGGGGGYVVPLVVLALGVGLFLQDTERFKGDDVLPPLIVLAIGLGLVLTALPARSTSKTERAQVELAGATRARVEVVHGAGSLRIGAHVGGDNLLEGRFGGGVDVRQRRDGERADVTLSANPWRVGFPWSRSGRLDWSLTLARHVPIELKVRTGASQTDADLSDVQVETLEIETGASKTILAIPSAGRPRIRIRAGAADIRVLVPSRMAARIQGRGALATVRVDERRFPSFESGYRSPDFESAADRAEIEVDAGAATVQIL